MDEAAHAEVVMIEQKGNLPVPVHLEITFTDGTKTTIHRNASVWKDGQSNIRVACPAGKKVKNVELGERTIPDVNPADNKWGA
jgi:hypothetical protein